MSEEDLDKLIKKLEGIIKDLKEKKKELSETELKEMQVELEIPKEKTKAQLINEHFEKCWKLVPSTQWDSKKRVTKDTKVRLYDYDFEAIKCAIETYLMNQKVEYRYKRDKFFNEIIWNYLDMEENKQVKDNAKSNFYFGGF